MQNKTFHSLEYRKDIDGLRAFAVLAVIFCHFQVPFFTGGFVGVDIFFVISGYLISSIILNKLHDGTFSFADFYERRARRIMPALLAVVCVLLLVPLAIGSFGLIREFYSSVIAACLFVSNMFFWKKGGYFDVPASEKPLLHTWSLGIEEQFYILIPLFFYITWRFMRHNLKMFLWIIAISSFVLSALMIHFKPNSVFFLLPTRAWELLCGALLALYQRERGGEEGRGHAIASFFALPLLLIPVFAYNSTTLFPAYAALLPCMGAVCYIYAGSFMKTSNMAFLNVVLSWKPFVAIGVISYSLYLWHWPVWVFLNQYLGESFGLGPVLIFFDDYGRKRSDFIANGYVKLYIKYIAAAITFACAYLAWRYCEQPVRLRKVLATRKSFLWMTSGVLAVVLLFSTALQNPEHWALRRFALYFFGSGYSLAALDTPTFQFDTEKYKILGGVPTSPPRYMVLGDSHLRHYADMLQELSQEANVVGIGGRAVIPLLNVNASVKLNGNMSQHLRYAVENKIPHVLLSARWTQWMLGHEPWAAKNDTSTVLLLHNSQVSEGVPFSSENSLKGLALALDETVAYLVANKIHVWIVLPTPEMPFSPVESLQQTFTHGGDVSKVGITWEVYMERAESTRKILMNKKSDFVHIIDPAMLLCEGGFCRTQSEGKGLYYDDDHLSLTGAAFVKKAFVPFFEAVKKSQ